VIFQDGGRRHLGFEKFEILTVDPAPGAKGQCASSCKISSSSVERLQINGDLTIFFKMAAVRHLGFLGRLLGPPTMTTWWSLSLRQIWLKSMQ